MALASSANSAPPPIALCLFGAPSLRVADRLIALSPKDAALLALIALEPALRPERAAAMLWPQATARQADTNLRQRLYRLRRNCAAPLVDTGLVLVLHPGVDVDRRLMARQIEEDDTAGRGDLLADLTFDDLREFSEWLAAQREAWHRERQQALAAAAERCEKAGAVARALTYAQRHADGEPLAEHSQRRLMRLHYLRGDHAAAITVFERLEHGLKDELGTRPSAETLELLATIERGARALPARRAVAPASLLRPPRLIAREREWAALAESWALRQVFVVAGEAGIGKSRLVGDFAQSEPGVVMIKMRSGDDHLPDAALARLARAVMATHGSAIGSHHPELATLMPELGGSLVEPSGAAQRAALQRALEVLIASAMAQGLRALVVDDVHCADEASLEILRALVGSDALESLCWGFARRAGKPEQGLVALQALLEDAHRWREVNLRPLTEPELADLVVSLGLPDLDPSALAHALMRQGGGNPMFAIETLRDVVLHGFDRQGGLPRPATVTALVERRLMQLSAPALRQARLAALAGSAFDAELAASVLEAHPLDLAEPWRELEVSQVVRDGAFAHDLVLEATRSSVPGPIAQLLHERIARYLEARGTEPASIAPHWAGAARWREAGESYAAAARRAEARSLRMHEVDDWERAADAFDRAGDRSAAFQSRCDSVLARIVVQGAAPARALAESLVAQAQSDGERAAAQIAVAHAALMAADHASGIAAATQAGELAGKLASRPLALESACLKAVGLTQAGRPAEGIAIIEAQRPMVDSGEATPRLRGRFWSDYAYALNGVRRLRDTAFALEQAILNAQQLGDLSELATLTSNLATVKGNLGAADEALALAQRALSLQSELGPTDGPEGGVVKTYVGLYCGVLGRYDEALAHIEEALDCFTRDRQVLWTAIAANHKAQLLMDLGQWAKARQALEYETPSVKSVRARRATLLARMGRGLGEPAHGGRALLEVQDSLGAGDDPHVRMHLALEVALHLPPDDSIARCDEVERWSTQLEFGGVALKAGLRGAQARVRSGEAAEAARRLRGLVARMQYMLPADLGAGEAWWIAAEVFDAAGDGDDALMALARGAQWLRRVALPHVPEPFRESFLERHPSHRALLAAADRRTLR